jgi:transcription-repair coupling factor (superfamily II helicase)
MHIPALIPDDYLFDVHARLTLYKRIAGAGSTDTLRELQVEMIDRFGLLPGPAKNLFRVAELRLAANALGITRLDFGPRGGRVEFATDTRASVEALLALVREHPLDYRLAGPERLSITTQEPDGALRLEQAATLLQQLRGGSEQL